MVSIRGHSEEITGGGYHQPRFSGKRHTIGDRQPYKRPGLIGR
jgi:hypothetical protein